MPKYKCNANRVAPKGAWRVSHDQFLRPKCPVYSCGQRGAAPRTVPYPCMRRIVRRIYWEWTKHHSWRGSGGLLPPNGLAGSRRTMRVGWSLTVLWGNCNCNSPFFCVIGFRVIVQTMHPHQRKLQLQRLLCLYNNPKPQPIFRSELPTVLLVSIPRGLFWPTRRLRHTSRELGHMVVIVDSRGVCVKKK